MIQSSESPPTLLDVEAAIRARRAVRDFDPRPLDSGVLESILDDARRAPSGYNLQPTHFVVVEGDGRADLAHAALSQRQVAEAPVTVVVVADTRPDLEAEGTLGRDLEAGAISEEYRNTVRRLVGISFGRGPAGLLALAKGLGVRVARWFRPVPTLPSSRPREWAAKQGMIAAAHILLSATARGIGSCPMEGFDEVRVARLLGIPRRYHVALLIPLGHERKGPEAPRRTREPLADRLHRGRWGVPGSPDGAKP